MTRTTLPAAPPILELLVPAEATENPELSIVIPAMNEHLTIAEFVSWCHEGLERAGVCGEIVIIDSSTDRTAEIAFARGARVLKTPPRGLGQAYRDALPYIRGQYVLMGDCDCTYDFRQIGPFMACFREGDEFIMGSRFRGYIEPGSMPFLHRYLGTPLTTWILNIIFSRRFTDIHCGMRGITRDALSRMDLQSRSWEYASEMVIKSVHMGLRSSEVPIRFLKDREGRLSHHKRTGWWSPWQAAWINLRAMFIYGANFFLFRPGLGLLMLGLLLTLPMAAGPQTVGAITFSLHWMLLGLTLSVLGLQCVYLGILTQVFFDCSGRVTQQWFARFRYTRAILTSVGLVLGGAFLTGILLVDYVRNGFRLAELGLHNYWAVLGLLFMICGFMTFAFTLVLHSTAVAVRRGG